MNHKQMLLRVLSTQKLAILATFGSVYPYQNLVAICSARSGRYIYFSTPRATNKYANITRNPNVAFFVDNRTNTPADFHRAVGITACGRAVEVSARAKPAAARRFLAVHPYLHEFVHSPSAAFFRVRVSTYYMVSSFQRVSIIKP